MKLKNKQPGKVVKAENTLWAGITEDDFLYESGIEDREIGQYDKETVTLFAANTNLFRQLVRLSDSLKPVERRTLYAMYLLHATPGNKTKSAQIVASTMKYHPHGDAVSYGALVGLTQPWKKQCPLVKGIGNFGNAENQDFFAHYRYTEAYLSKYGYECFFEDFDMDCVETMFNSSSDTDEPMALPSKFPNILVNGGFGIAFGNSFRIPPFNIDDIITNCRKLLSNPNCPDVFMIPDFPCDCDIVDDGTELHNLIDHGVATLKMRGRISIEEYGKHWMLRITSVPWMVNFQSVIKRINALAKTGTLPIMDHQNASYSIMMPDKSVETRIDFRIIVNSAHDPNVIRDKLYSLTELEKSVNINFKVVTDNLSVDRLNMKDLIQSWIDERRSFLRRLFNKKLTQISARIDFLDILIYLLRDEKNIQKTISVIRRSKEDDNVCEDLQKLCKMTSYQARRVADIPLRQLNAGTRKKSEDEKKKLEAQRKEIMQTIRSEKKIDAIIAEQLEDLRKYASPRRTNVIEPHGLVKIQDTNHNLIVTHDGFIKKLMYNGQYKLNMGAFKNGDYPIYRGIFNNMDSVIFFDNFGRYSVVPVHQIDNNEPSQYGHTVFGTAKLSGRIVAVTKHFSEDMLDLAKSFGTPYMVTATAQGYIKKTPLDVYMQMRSTKNVRCMKIRDDDSLVCADIIFGNKKLLIYTKRGKFVYLTADSISEQAKDAMGLIGIKPDDDDEVRGITVVGDSDEYIGIVTNKGIIKKCEVKYLGDPVKRSASNSNSYLTSLEVGDEVNSVIPLQMGSGMIVCTRTDIYTLAPEEIPVMSRKGKGKKLIPVPVGVNIINVFETNMSEKTEEEAIEKSSKKITTSKKKSVVKKKTKTTKK